MTHKQKTPADVGLEGMTWSGALLAAGLIAVVVTTQGEEIAAWAHSETAAWGQRFNDLRANLATPQPVQATVVAAPCGSDATLPAFTLRSDAWGGGQLRDEHGAVLGMLQGFGGHGELVVLDPMGDLVGIYNPERATWRSATDNLVFDVYNTDGGQAMSPHHPMYRTVRGMLQTALPNAPCPGLTPES